MKIATFLRINFAAVMAFGAATSFAQVPAVVSYQGRVQVGANNFSGNEFEKKASVANFPFGALSVKVKRVVSEVVEEPKPLSLGALSTRSRNRMQKTALFSAATSAVPGCKLPPKVSPRL